MSKKLTILSLALLAIVLACNKNDPPSSSPRTDLITVYDAVAGKTVDNIQIPFDGAQNGQIHIRYTIPSDQKLQWRQLVDPSETGTDWLTIKSVEDVEPGHAVVTYDATSLLAMNKLDRRSSNLSFYCPNLSLGKFISIRQGYQRQYSGTSGVTDETITITGEETYTTQEYPKLNVDYCDYISFNVWARNEHEFNLTKNITLDITVSGGHFYETGLATYRVNVPLGTGPEKSNMVYLLVAGNGKRMSTNTHFIFSTDNDKDVYVSIKNFSIYKVTEAEMLELIDDEDFEGEDEPDWV